jgi:xanthine/uracil permease
MHYYIMTMAGSLELLRFLYHPFLIVTPVMGATENQTAEVISTIFFVSGINTWLVQTTLGDRLPIVQGGLFAYRKQLAQLSLSSVTLLFRLLKMTTKGSCTQCKPFKVPSLSQDFAR